MNTGLIRERNEADTRAHDTVAARQDARPHLSMADRALPAQQTQQVWEGKVVLDVIASKRDLKLQKQQLDDLFKRHEELLNTMEGHARDFVSAIRNCVSQRTTG